MVTQLLLWAALSMLDNPFSEETFPNIQSKPPPAQPEAISRHPISAILTAVGLTRVRSYADVYLSKAS